MYIYITLCDTCRLAHLHVVKDYAGNYLVGNLVVRA